MLDKFVQPNTCEFQRTSRSLGELSCWKATEFRLFLLYIGIVVLNGILPEALFKHCALLHVAARILNSRKFCIKYLDYAHLYLERFVFVAQHIYGYESQIMVMHLLGHVVDDIRYFKRPLYELAAYVFESTLGKIKNKLRSGNRPLEQLCQRMLEEILLNKEKASLPKEFEIESFTETKYHIFNIKRLRMKQFTLTPKRPNNTVMLKNKIFVNIKKISSCSKDFEKYCFLWQFFRRSEVSLFLPD